VTKKISLLIIFVIVCNSNTYANNTRFDSLITAGIDQIYNIKLSEAKTTFGLVIKEFPKQPAGYFFDTMILWWKILLDFSNEKYDDQFIDRLEYVIDFCDDILDKDPKNVDALFFKGGSLGFRGRLYAYRENWFDAALDGKDALPLVYSAYSADPKNIDVQLGFGIYNYYASVIPEKFPAVKPFMVFFPKGDKEKGLKQLDYVSRDGKYAKIESLYFLATSYFSIENNYDKAMDYTLKLTSQYPDNPKFQSLLGRIWIRTNSYKTAAPIFREIFKRSIAGMPGYNDVAKREAVYYLGAYYDEISKYDSAKYYFEICETASNKLDEDEESGFLINAGLYLGKIYARFGDTKKAIKKFEQVLDYREYNESYSKAKKELTRIKDQH